MFYFLYNNFFFFFLQKKKKTLKFFVKFFSGQLFCLSKAISFVFFLLLFFFHFLFVGRSFFFIAKSFSIIYIIFVLSFSLLFSSKSIRLLFIQPQDEKQFDEETLVNVCWLYMCVSKERQGEGREKESEVWQWG